MVNPKPFYDSIEETLDERLTVAMDKAHSMGYQKGLKDGYRLAQKDRGRPYQLTHYQREMLKSVMRENARKDSATMKFVRRKLIDEGNNG